MTATRRADRVTGGALGTRSDLDTPFSARVVTSEELQERQVKSLARVFSEDASVVANGDTYTFNSYSQTVRGIPLDDYNSYRINGDPFYMTTVELPLESFEAVQLLKGASGFMYGFNAPGGLIDFETKRPTDTRFVSADLAYSSDGVLSQHADTGGRLLNDVLGYRLNLTHEQGETYSGSNVRRYSGSLGLDARISDDLLWTGDFIYQDRRIRGGTQDFYIDDPDTYTYGRLPRPISGTNNLSAYPDLFFNSHVYYGATGLRWSIGPRWTLHADYSISRDWRDYKSEWMPLQNDRGDYQLALDTDPRSWSTYNQAQAVLEGRFDTWILHHQLTFGASWQQLDKYLPFNDLDDVEIGAENLYAPVMVHDYPSDFDDRVYKNFHSEQEGVFASDTVSLGPVSLLGGLRFTDYFEADYDGQGGRTAYTETPVTPVAALFYHPWRDATLYVSYVQALQSGQTVPDNYVNARQTLPVILSDQIEIGAKIEQRSWSLSAALYRIDEGAQYANAANVYVSNGTQRYDGIEANGHVLLPVGLELTNSIAAERATYLQADASVQGKNVEGVPSIQDTVQLTESPHAVPGFSATAEVHYTAHLWGDDFNSYRIPSATLLNLRASYRLAVDHHPVTLRAELDNVANLHYWGFLESDYFFVGPPRTLFLDASVKF